MNKVLVGADVFRQCHNQVRSISIRLKLSVSVVVFVVYRHFAGFPPALEKLEKLEKFVFPGIEKSLILKFHQNVR